MNLFRIIFLLSLISSHLHSQQFGTWQNYTNMNNVKIATAFGEYIWAATDGGVFGFNKSDSTYNLFTKSEGLNSQNVTALAVNKNGDVWIGTAEGYINIIQPLSKKVISILDIHDSNFDQKAISYIFIIGSNAYVSTDFGVTVINTADFSIVDNYQKFGGFPSGIKAISVTKRNLIYVATENGVAIQKANAINLAAPESWNTYSLGTSIPASQVFEVDEFDGEVIASTNSGIFSFNGTGWNQRYFAGNSIIDFEISADSILAIIGQQLFSSRNDQNRLLASYNSASLNSIFIDGSEKYICSNNGVFDLANNRTIAPNGPFANSFLNMGVDNSGNLWAASGRDNGKGIYKFNGNLWENFNINNTPEFLSNSFHNVYSAPDNSVYFSNWGSGFTRYKNGNFTTFSTQNTDLVGIPNAPTFLVIWDAAADSRNDIWILNYWTASRNTLSLLTKDSTWYHFSPPFPLSVTLAEYLVIDRNNTKWFSNKNEDLGGLGLYYFNDNNTPSDISDDKWGVYRKSTNGLNDDGITALAVDKRGEVWIGTPLGINVIFDPSNLGGRVSNLFGAISQQSITCITVDELNQKWVGTNQGVFLLSPDGSVLIEQYNTQNSPIPFDEILCITIDDNSGLVYIGTDAGLTSLRSTSIKPQNTFSDLFVYPNPFIIGETDNSVFIEGLVRDSEIKILTISGQLVNEFITPGGSIAIWNGKDMEGKNVSSGVYLIIAHDAEANNVATAKVAVIKN